MGLSNGSVGMQMLDGLFEKGQISRSGSGGDWGDVLKVLTAGKVSDWKLERRRDAGS